MSIGRPVIITRFAAGLLMWGGLPARAQVEPDQSPVMFGYCELAADPQTAPDRDRLGLLLCLKGNVGAEVTSVSGAPEENSWAKYAKLYGGLFLTEWLALQARGDLLVIEPLGDKVMEDRDLRTDYASLQIGNPALHMLRLTAGRMRLPFGIDRSAATEHYRSFENRSFWDSPRYGGYLTIDNMVSTTLEVGYGTDQLSNSIRDAEKSEVEGSVNEQPEGSGAEISKNQAASVRFMTDFAALDGSRLILSGYGESEGERRFGAGFLTVSAKDDLTLFEFVRIVPSPFVDDGRFQQLLRLGYIGSWRSDTRWIMQFDDERHVFRRGMLGHDARIYGNFALRLAISYHKSEAGDDLRRWYVTSGLEASL